MVLYGTSSSFFFSQKVKTQIPVNWLVCKIMQTVEKRPREMMLRREFANAVGYLNQILLEESQLKFIHWDFHKFAKRFFSLFVSCVWCKDTWISANNIFFLPYGSKSANVLAVLGAVASEALDLTGFYYSGKPIIFKRRATQLGRTSTGRYLLLMHRYLDVYLICMPYCLYNLKVVYSYTITTACL